MSAILASIVVLTNLAYTAAFDTETRCPAWVAYNLEPHEVVVTNRATIPFRADPRVKESDNLLTTPVVGMTVGTLHRQLTSTSTVQHSRKRTTSRTLHHKSHTSIVARGSTRRTRCGGLPHQGQFTLSRSLFLKTPIIPGVRRIGQTTVPTAFVKIAYGWFGVRHWRFQNVEWRSGWNSLTNQKKEITK